MVYKLDEERRDMKPKYNRETGMYEVYLYGRLNEFDTFEDAQEFLRNAMEDYFDESFVKFCVPKILMHF